MDVGCTTEEETFEDPRGAYPLIPAKVIEILIKRKMITFPIPPEFYKIKP